MAKYNNMTFFNSLVFRYQFGYITMSVEFVENAVRYLSWYGPKLWFSR